MLAIIEPSISEFLPVPLLSPLLSFRTLVGGCAGDCCVDESGMVSLLDWFSSSSSGGGGGGGGGGGDTGGIVVGSGG